MEGPLAQQITDSALYLLIGAAVVNALSKSQSKARLLHALAAICALAAAKTVRMLRTECVSAADDAVRM